jgi:iron complex outermembrane receptor protein
MLFSPLNKTLLSSAIASALCLGASSVALAEEFKFELEEVIIVAEKRQESLQDVSQAVTALTGDDLAVKNINSFVDISGIAPGVTITKNEGFKTIIAIRGIGNEANQNAVANPSVSYHMDGIYIASPFALQTDFLDVSRIEALRGPQGTLFGQNSTGGAINVISEQPSLEEFSGKAQLTVGNHDKMKLAGTVNVPVSDTLAMRTAVAKDSRSGYSKNVLNGQDLDESDNISLRTDWLFTPSETISFRMFAQYFSEDSNGAAIKGINDPTPGARNLSQDTEAAYELDSKVVGAIYEWDAGLATVKALASWQEDDIYIKRDNDRHSYRTNPEIIISEYNPETNKQSTKTFEINIISNEPLMDKVDWILGAFYLDTEIDIAIREELDSNGNGILDGYPEVFPDVFLGEVGFISDAHPTRESLSFYGQGTLPLNDEMRVIFGARYTEDEVKSTVANFFTPFPDNIETSTDAITGRIAVEYDISGDSMFYASATHGFKPGGSNLTYGNSDDGSPALVTPSYNDESIDAYEMGLKSELMDGRVRANLSAFFYDYQDMQFQATDPDPFQGGVANIPEAEVSGIELELTALLTESLILDMKIATLNSEITADFDALDNVKAQPYFFGQELIRYNLRENVKGNSLAKSPDLTADISLRYEKTLASGNEFSGTVQFTYRGEFSQRIFENPAVDDVDAYEVLNLVASWDRAGGDWGIDLMAMNVLDEDGVNSRMTDVFGVSATGVELIPPRQVMAKVRYSF